MEPMAHTGDSANISWYAERHQGDRDYYYAEVLRDDVERSPGGALLQRRVPEYHFRLRHVTEAGNRDAGRFTYQPSRRPNPLVLGNRTVTRLVREHLEKDNDHARNNRQHQPAPAGRGGNQPAR